MPAPSMYHLRTIIDNVPSIMAYWDRSQHCRYANRAYEQWFGKAPEGMIGTALHELLGPELYALNRPFIEAALAGQPQTFERVVPSPSGVRRDALAHYIPHVVDGEVLGFIVHVTEVTQIRQLQEALERERQLSGRLEAHAVELDMMLQQRNEMIDVLAHEVRQPLNNASAALQSASAALAELGDAAAQRPVARAQAVLSQILGRLDNTLAEATLLARAEPILHVDTDLDMLVALAVADMAERDRARVRVEHRTEARTASIDLSLMRLALRNLIGNALKFSPVESTVVVRLSEIEDPLAVVIDVIDQGPGITAAMLPRLFERGARGKLAGAGHGLGLHIARRVMDLHGGALEVAPGTQPGCTMRLVLPASMGE